MDPVWTMCTRRSPTGRCLGCTTEDVNILLSLSVRDSVADDQALVGAVACLLHELLGPDSPFPTPWTLHKAPRLSLHTNDWVITAPLPEKSA